MIAQSRRELSRGTALRRSGEGSPSWQPPLESVNQTSGDGPLRFLAQADQHTFVPVFDDEKKWRVDVDGCAMEGIDRLEVERCADVPGAGQDDTEKEHALSDREEAASANLRSLGTELRLANPPPRESSAQSGQGPPKPVERKLRAKVDGR
jgi:hypothetical protein